MLKLLNYMFYINYKWFLWLNHAENKTKNLQWSQKVQVQVTALLLHEDLRNDEKSR